MFSGLSCNLACDGRNDSQWPVPGVQECMECWHLAFNLEHPSNHAVCRKSSQSMDFCFMVDITGSMATASMLANVVKRWKATVDSVKEAMQRLQGSMVSHGGLCQGVDATTSRSVCLLAHMHMSRYLWVCGHDKSVRDEA